MAYDHPEPLKDGEYYVSYPHVYTCFSGNEKQFKGYLKGYLMQNEPTSKAVGVTKDLKLVCIEDPENTRAMVRETIKANQAAKAAKKAKPKKKGRKR